MTIYHHQVGDVLQLDFIGRPAKVLSQASGGFGAVYCIRDEGTGAIAAVKTIRADLELNESQLRRFEEEARVWVGLPALPSIAEALMVGNYNRRPYIFTEYVRAVGSGSSAEHLITDAPPGKTLSLGLCLSITLDLLLALRAIEVYDSSLVHGDIKPGNLLIQKLEGQLSEAQQRKAFLAKLSDFGLSHQRLVRDVSVTSPGDVRYLAPERWPPSSAMPIVGNYIYALGASDTSNLKSSEAYSVGCTVFHMLFGYPWQSIDSAGHRHQLGTPEALELLSQSDAPRGLASWLSACLNHAPDARPQSYGELNEGFMELLAASGYRVTEIGPVETDGPLPLMEDTGTYKHLTEGKRLGRSTSARICDVLLLAGKLRGAGHQQQARELVAPLAEEHPELPQPFAAVGHGFVLEGRRAEALGAYVNAIRLWERDEAGMRLDSWGYVGALATLAQLQSDPSIDGFDPVQALVTARKALRLEPNVAKVRLAMGTALVSGGRDREAVDELMVAHQLDPSNMAIQYQLAIAADLASVTLDRSIKAVDPHVVAAAANRWRRLRHARLRDGPSERT